MIFPYQEELQVKYQRIKDFIHELAILNGRKEKLMEIYFWLSTYPYLSQAEVQVLTGYSLGTISESLKSLTEVSVVNLRPRENSSVSEYFLRDSKTSLDYTLISRGKSLVSRILDFMAPLLKRMENPNPETQDLLMLENLQDFHQYYLWVTRRLSGEKAPFDPGSLVKVQERPLNPVFSLAFERMEKEFIDFFVKQQIFEEMTEKNSQVHGLFITRGNLTISELSKRLPFSIGTVSTSVHYLETLLLVHKNDGKYGYCMYSYGVAWLNYRDYYYQRMRIWQNEFSQMKLDLEENLNDYHFNPQIGPFLIFLTRLLTALKRAQKFYSENAPLWKIAYDFSIDHPQYYPSISKNEM